MGLILDPSERARRSREYRERAQRDFQRKMMTPVNLAGDPSKCSISCYQHRHDMCNGEFTISAHGSCGCFCHGPWPRGWLMVVVPSIFYPAQYNAWLKERYPLQFAGHTPT